MSPKRFLLPTASNVVHDVAVPGSLVELTVSELRYRGHVATVESLYTIFHDQVTIGTLITRLFWSEIDESVRLSVDSALAKEGMFGGDAEVRLSYGIGARCVTNVILVSSARAKHHDVPVDSGLPGRIVFIPTDTRFAEVKLIDA